MLAPLALLLSLSLHAQKEEQGFDHSFKPTGNAPRYYVITERENGLWHRQAYYIPERSMAMEGWYKDKACTLAEGEVVWYHPNKFVMSRGSYVNGKKEGTWLEYGEEGRLRDSTTYVAGRKKGIGLHWYADGALSDSTNFDGAGNGAEVRWYPEGTLWSAGYVVSDTSKRGRWNYYHPNGKVMATEDYTDGKLLSCNCFDETGKAFDSTTCQGKEADFPGGTKAWIGFIQRNLKAEVPVRKKAPEGQYMVVVQFIVAKDGRIEDVKPLTHFGFGMEEEVVRLIKASPRWEPAEQFGRRVKAYRKQPITFVVSNG
jgi:antitoxin component YwqK of YwqJK toxin-antitoxin module